MKSEATLRKSVDARLNDVTANALLVANCADELREEFNGKTMSEMREYLADLTQAVHEYNAYYNTLTTK